MDRLGGKTGHVGDVLMLRVLCEMMLMSGEVKRNGRSRRDDEMIRSILYLLDRRDQVDLVVAVHEFVGGSSSGGNFFEATIHRAPNHKLLVLTIFFMKIVSGNVRFGLKKNNKRNKLCFDGGRCGLGGWRSAFLFALFDCLADLTRVEVTSQPHSSIC